MANDELLEVKHGQKVLHTQNEKQDEEVRALRAQVDALPATPVGKSWAAVTASHLPLQPNHQRTDRCRNCVRISTQRPFVDPTDNDKSEQNTSGRYLPTESQTSISARRYRTHRPHKTPKHPRLVPLKLDMSSALRTQNRLKRPATTWKG